MENKIKLYVVSCGTSILGIYVNKDEAISSRNENNNKKYRNFKAEVCEYEVENDPESLAIFGYRLSYKLTR